MSTISLHSTGAPQRASARPAKSRARQFGSVALLSAATLLIHGYHPLAEDGGLYVAGVEYQLNPALFPHDTAFVTAHLRYSIFSPLLAGIVRATHLPLDWLLLLAYLTSIAITLFAAQQLLHRCVQNPAAQFSGLALLAAWWTLPIAGTSLLLMDPYLTARSFSTPLALLAVAFALDPWPHPRSWVPHSSHSTWRHEWGSTTVCALSLFLAALFHPLMAAYAMAFVLLLRLMRLRNHRTACLLFLATALTIAATLNHIAPPDAPAATAAAITRYYWFLSQWHWYELCGLAGPLLVFALLLRWQRSQLSRTCSDLLRAGIWLGGTATVVALLFARQSAPAHLVARLQPLRAFLLLYAVMALLLAAILTQTLLNATNADRWRLRSRTPRWLPSIPFITVAALATVSFFIQRSTFPASPHIELPTREARIANPWVQAFLWVRANTPQNAVFALNDHYINEPGEDAQTFRAWSQRSALPDFSKDGGEAAITPALAPRWQQAATAQRGLSTEKDRQRDPLIQPLGAKWMLVHSSTPTQHPCPYDNGTIKVCSLEH